MEAFVACRLIPLNKNPGVRIIGVCECLRRLVGKTTLLAVGQYVREVTGALQWCAGQSAGIEAAIHTMRDIFIDDECEGILLVDARNAFKNLNRQVALHNVNRLCPALGKVLINTYRTALPQTCLWVARASNRRKAQSRETHLPGPCMPS